LIDKQIISYLKIFHGLFNFTIMLLFFYHGTLGFLIRKARLSKGPFPLKAVKRHRKAGPILMVCGVLGFIAGMVVMYLDEGKVLQYRLHFGTGAVIVMLLLATFGISRFIKGPDSPLRVPHSVIGVMILALYVFQCFLGLLILL
jgi:hypothetical protein